MAILDLFRKKKEPAVALAMPLLAAVAEPNLETLQASLRETSGGLRFKRAKKHDQGSEVEFDRGRCMSATMPVPVPSRDLELPIQLAWHWDNAEEVVRAHRAHVVATAISDAGDRLAAQLALTSYVAALLRAIPTSVGVYSGATNLVLSRTYYLDAASGASADNLPMPLWLNLLPLPDGRGLTTHGMHAFGLMELEFDGWGDHSDAMNRAYNFGEYLIRSGPVIEDGHTVGFSAKEKITVRHGPSAIDATQMVYRFLPPAN